MGDHAEEARDNEEREYNHNEAVLEADLRIYVRNAYKAYPHLLNQLDIIWRQAMIEMITDRPTLEVCSDAKIKIDELLLENQEE